jgi:hypothetical protein
MSGEDSVAERFCDTDVCAIDFVASPLEDDDVETMAS